jgi:hypothetical protein
MTERKNKMKEKEGSGTPTDAVFHVRTSGCGARHEVPARADPPLRARSPVGVPLTVLTRRLPPLRAASGQASWDVAGAPVCHIPLPEAEPNAVCAGVTRPNLSQSSDAPHGPVLVPVS